MIIVGWCGIAWLAPGLFPGARSAIAAGTIVTILVALAIFVALNPFLTAGPAVTDLAPRGSEISRSRILGNGFLFQVEHRVELVGQSEE